MTSEKLLLLSTLTLIILFTPVTVSATLQHNNSQIQWTCFDYATNWTEQYPDWGMVVISHNPRFQSYNHLVNYKIYDNGTMLIHDELNKKEYLVGGWEYDNNTLDYYHFYTKDETPKRYYRYLLPNARKKYNERLSSINYGKDNILLK